MKFHQLKFSGIQTGFGFDSDKQAYFEVDQVIVIQGVFFNWSLPKKLKYLKPRLSESTLT